MSMGYADDGPGQRIPGPELQRKIAKAAREFIDRAPHFGGYRPSRHSGKTRQRLSYAADYFPAGRNAAFCKLCVQFRSFASLLTPPRERSQDGVRAINRQAKQHRRIASRAVYAWRCAVRAALWRDEADAREVLRQARECAKEQHRKERAGRGTAIAKRAGVGVP